MKFLALIVVLAISLNVVTACTPSTNGMCNPDLLQCCGLQLKSDLGLSNCYGILAFEPECHRQEIENMYINGISGLMKVCDSFNKYYECLGSARRDCTSISYHVKAGLRLPDAVKVVSMYKQFGFACGAGFEGFANNDACMSQIFATKQTQINSCRAKFANNILADYKNHCMYFEQYTGCFNALFDHSSCNAESTWWGCEYARQSGRVVLHDCNLQCSKSNNFTARQHLPWIIKITGHTGFCELQKLDFRIGQPRNMMLSTRFSAIYMVVSKIQDNVATVIVYDENVHLIDPATKSIVAVRAYIDFHPFGSSSSFLSANHIILIFVSYISVHISFILF